MNVYLATTRLGDGRGGVGFLELFRPAKLLFLRACFFLSRISLCCGLHFAPAQSLPAGMPAAFGVRLENAKSGGFHGRHYH